MKGDVICKREKITKKTKIYLRNSGVQGIQVFKWRVTTFNFFLGEIIILKSENISTKFEKKKTFDNGHKGLVSAKTGHKAPLCEGNSSSFKERAIEFEKKERFVHLVFLNQNYGIIIVLRKCFNWLELFLINISNP